MNTSYVYLPKTTYNNEGINWYNDNLLKREDGQVMQTIINLGNDVEQLIDKIEELTWCTGVVDWHITEDFTKSGEREYSLQGLKMEIEDNIVICSDMNDELYEDISRVLNTFLVDSIVNIEVHVKNVIKIFFKNGSITIKGIGTR